MHTTSWFGVFCRLQNRKPKYRQHVEGTDPILYRNDFGVIASNLYSLVEFGIA